MSLLVWLPLNGNLNNYGISPAKFSMVNGSNGLGIATTGKISQTSYVRNTVNTADYITSDINFLLDKDFSMCCWAKVTECKDTTANGLITCHGHTTGGSGITVKRIDATDFRMSFNTGVSDPQRTYNKYYSNINIYNAWHHLCITYNRKELKYCMYIDGKQQTIIGNSGVVYGDYITYGDSIAPRPFRLFDWSVDHSSNASYRPKCQLNDVRLYDHCLSNKEVKLISQGLIAHYRLNNPNLNLPTTRITTIPDLSGYGNNGTPYNTIAYDIDSKKNIGSAIFNGTNTAINCGRGPMVKDAITVNAWAYKENWSTGTDAERIISCTEGGGWNFEYQRRFICHNGQEYLVAESSKKFSTLSSGWHMFTGVYDGITAKIYIDGTLTGISDANSVKTDISYYETSPKNVIWIGAEATNSIIAPANGYFTGKINEVKIFCTALSANDIAELYTLGCAMSSNGSILALQYVEKEIANNKFKSNSVIESENFSEITQIADMPIKILNDNSVWARIHWLDVTSDVTYFANASEVNYCVDKSNRYSRMGIIDNFKGKKIRMTNLLKRPTMEDSGFDSNSTPNAKIKYPGGASLKITGIANDNETYSISTYTIPYIPGHTYYARMELYQETLTTNAQGQMYWRSKEPSFGKSSPLTEKKAWTPIGFCRTISADNAEWPADNYNFRIDFDNNGAAGEMLFDGLLLIDLTETFGAGCEPDATWCNKNIPFFTGTQTVEIDDGDYGWYEFMLTYPRMDAEKYNRWKQTSSPNDSASKNYTPIHVDWTKHAGGIRKTGDSSVYNCDTVGSSTWFAAIGQTSRWTSNATTQIPSASQESTTETELWVRIDTLPHLNKLSFSNKQFIQTSQIIEM